MCAGVGVCLSVSLCIGERERTIQDKSMCTSLIVNTMCTCVCVCVRVCTWEGQAFQHALCAVSSMRCAGVCVYAPLPLSVYVYVCEGERRMCKALIFNALRGCCCVCVRLSVCLSMSV